MSTAGDVWVIVLFLFIVVTPIISVPLGWDNHYVNTFLRCTYFIFYSTSIFILFSIQRCYVVFLLFGFVLLIITLLSPISVSILIFCLWPRLSSFVDRHLCCSLSPHIIYLYLLSKFRSLLLLSTQRRHYSNEFIFYFLKHIHFTRTTYTRSDQHDGNQLFLPNSSRQLINSTNFKNSTFTWQRLSNHSQVLWPSRLGLHLCRGVWVPYKEWPSWLGMLSDHRLYLYRGKSPPNDCPRYDNKQSDGETPLMLELCGMWSTPSLTSLPGTLWLGVVARDRVPSMGQIELNSVLMLNWIV